MNYELCDNLMQIFSNFEKQKSIVGLLGYQIISLLPAFVLLVKTLDQETYSTTIAPQIEILIEKSILLADDFQSVIDYFNGFINACEIVFQEMDVNQDCVMFAFRRKLRNASKELAQQLLSLIDGEYN